MNIKFFCKGLSSEVDKKLRDYIDKKITSFEKLLMEFDDDTVQMQITAERYEKNNAYNVEIILKMPKKTIVANEDSHSIEKAVDLAKDRIIKQMKKAGEKNRIHRKRDSKEKEMTKTGVIVGLERIHRSLETYKKKDQKSEFEKALKSVLEKLQAFISRELYYYTKQEDISREEINEKIILDEVVAEFYENFHASLDTEMIEQWLYSVAIQKIEEVVNEEKREKGEKIRLNHDAAESKDETRLSQYFMNEDMENLQSAIFSDRTKDEEVLIEPPESDLSKKEAFLFLIEKMTEIPPMQRHAFMLSVMEGFSLNHIAKIQKRTEAEVKNDIEQVQEVLLQAAKEEFGEEYVGEVWSR